MLVDFSKFSSVRVGGVFEVEILNDENLNSFDGVVIGGANNILISPNPPKLGMLDKSFDYIKFDSEILEIGALAKNSKIYNFAKKNNLANFEFLRSIPGTLGGLITMNAGLLGYEISQNLISVSTNLGEFNKNELIFGYRKSQIKGVIKSAKFRALKGFDLNLSDEISKKRANQPKGASFGSCFKNPPNSSAGQLIQSVGLKGYEIGGAKFSEIHANFIINFNHAKFEDIMSLINLAKKRVFEKFGLNLESEVKIL
ncbi:UDP-N-acetylmuramate dehydrogenase [Campylobacter sp. FMV-PI01]|uniref:UDP-N-acetylenolpyruvoylglucosamine reductase n=1 Tax=Campylobacter portucalensis TaxID=2608384 RepID=A0A6L5WIS1_9BACT|nr:UDP-N-acetylmuramate dehydrogenase [Campylobacter portucalensis]MSN95895.1 UDP-N-acetylmuramate dehydrogenase [Campylobacter portucalensis]